MEAMDKIKVFNSFFDTFAGSNFQNNQNDNDYYKYAINRLKIGLNKNSFTQEEINEEIAEITFWACYNYTKNTSRIDEPIIDIAVADLPINMNPEKLQAFKTALEIVVDTYQEISQKLGKESPISMEQFKNLFTQTEELSIPIPLVFLGT